MKKFILLLVIMASALHSSYSQQHGPAQYLGAGKIKGKVTCPTASSTTNPTVTVTVLMPPNQNYLIGGRDELVWQDHLGSHYIILDSWSGMKGNAAYSMPVIPTTSYNIAVRRFYMWGPPKGGTAFQWTKRSPIQNCP